MAEARKLAAILAADIVGYSRLTQTDEDRTLARLRALRSDLIDPTIAVHHGRIVKRTGDGAIVEFRSVVDAVACAREVQTAMIDRNAGVVEDQRILFRIGVHVGDVVEEGDGDLMGDGVNIAARLEGVAKPGAICLSEDAYRQVKGRLDLKISDLGPTSLKNIAEPVHVYSLEVGSPAVPHPAATAPLVASRRWPAPAALLAALVIVAAVVGWGAGFAPRWLGLTSTENRRAVAPHLSIVVLPFANLSGDPEQEYFAEAITEDLTTDLSHLADSFVIARNTAFTYKGKAVDVRQLGAELGVRYVLEGSVRRLGETVTINAQLVSAETGGHVWADRFEGERSRLGELQVEVVARLARSLGVELEKEESLRAARERPDAPDALDLAMHGWTELNKTRTREVIEQAIAYFEKALSVNPRLPSALTGLSIALSGRASDPADASRPQDIRRAVEAADQAIEIEPTGAFAHAAKGYALSQSGRHADALDEAALAREYDRNFAPAYADAASYMVAVGEAAKAGPLLETALRLSPRDPLVPYWQFTRCHIFTHLQQWEQAIEWCKRASAAIPSYWIPYMDLLAANACMGHVAEAKESLASLVKLKPDLTIKAIRAFGALYSTNPTFAEQLERILDCVRKGGLPDP